MNTPARYDSRYDSPLPPTARGCLLCGTPVGTARAYYCSPGCKQRAYRLRQATSAGAVTAARAAELQRRQRLTAQTIYECPVCAERYLGERRCADCNRFCRALGLGGRCPDCDAPILLSDLLGEEVLT